MFHQRRGDVREQVAVDATAPGGQVFQGELEVGGVPGGILGFDLERLCFRWLDSCGRVRKGCWSDGVEAMGEGGVAAAGAGGADGDG